MYACTHESDSKFFGGCGGRGIDRLLFATHPYRPAIREWYCASTPCPVLVNGAAPSAIDYVAFVRGGVLRPIAAGECCAGVANRLIG